MPNIVVKELNSPTINIMLPDGINVRIDPVADVLYIKIRDSEIVQTKEDKEGILVDLDKRGNLVGISVIHPKKVVIERRTVFKRIAKQFHVPTVNNIRPECFARGYAYA